MDLHSIVAMALEIYILAISDLNNGLLQLLCCEKLS